MDIVEIEAPAKINLGLLVGRKRDDGYHDIRSVMQTVSLADRLVLRKGASGCRLAVDAPGLPAGPDNLVHAAWERVRRLIGADLGVRIELHKSIPVAAGLAGGSADAAATIVGLNALYELGLSRSTMMGIAAEIGSDVPFCVPGGAALVEGRGERLEPLPGLPESTVILARPREEVSTRWAYANLRKKLTVPSEKIDYLIRGLRSGDLSRIGENLYNSFDSLISHHFPVLNRIRSGLMEIGALGTCLTGSGPTIFGLFSRPVDYRSELDDLLPGDVDVLSACPFPARVLQTST